MNISLSYGITGGSQAPISNTNPNNSSSAAPAPVYGQSGISNQISSILESGNAYIYYGIGVVLLYYIWKKSK